MLNQNHLILWEEDKASYQIWSPSCSSKDFRFTKILAPLPPSQRKPLIVNLDFIFDKIFYSSCPAIPSKLTHTQWARMPKSRNLYYQSVHVKYSWSIIITNATLGHRWFKHKNFHFRFNSIRGFRPVRISCVLRNQSDDTDVIRWLGIPTPSF